MIEMCVSVCVCHVCVCACVCRCKNQRCWVSVSGKSSPWFAFRSSLHLAQEMSPTVVLQAAGEDLAASLRHQQGVFKLS